MAYTYDFDWDFGDSQTGLTVHLKRYDHAGTLQETITTGIVEIGHGKYIYRHTTLPDGSVGTMLAYDSADASINALDSYRPVASIDQQDIIDALTTYTVATSAEVEDIAEAIEALGTSASITLVNVVDGDEVVIYRSDTWNFQITVPLVLTDYEAVALVVKSNESQTDDEALLYVRSDTGLQRVGGATPVGGSAAGSLTVNSATQFTVKVDITATVSLLPANYIWWLKVFDTTPAPDEGYTRAVGSFVVREYGLRAIV